MKYIDKWWIFYIIAVVIIFILYAIFVVNTLQKQADILLDIEISAGATENNINRIIDLLLLSLNITTPI